jgi:plasmid stability protein
MPTRKPPRPATRGSPTTPLAQLHVRLDPALYRTLKVRAAQEGAKLQDLVADLLARGLKARGGAK